MNQTPKRRNTGWGREIARAFGIIGRVLLIALRWVLNVLITVLLIGAITGIIVGSAFAIYVKNFVETEVDESKFVLTQTNQTTKIYYMDYEDRVNRIGTPVELVDQRLYGESNNLIASFSEFPQHLIEACVSAEDERFWNHKGVDWYRTVGAAANFVLKFSEDEFGGSTITQQLIKNVTGEKDYKIQRKVQEIFWALDLEKKMSKEDIITMYLNIIPLSRNCYGVKSAAHTYFGKDVSDLTLLESCAIIAITNNPSVYDPVSNPKMNTKRRNGILHVMLEEGIITQSEYDANFNKELELNLQISTTEPTVYSWFTDVVYEDVLADLMEQGYSKQIATQMLWSGGLEIYTVMDPDVQAVLDEVYQDDANFPENKSGLPAQSSMVVIDPYTGDLLGVAGGRGEKTINRGQNFATKSVRPAGSSIKPLSVYGPALEEGIITYASVFDDVPVNFGTYNLDPEKGDIKQPDAWPNNYPAEYRGLTNVNSAIERSVNTVAVRVLQKLSLDKSFDFVYNKLKMKSLIELKTLENGVRLTDKDVAALALGQLNYGCTVREITAAYSVFANKGVFNEARSYIKVLDSEGQVILANDSAGTVLMSEANAAIMTKMLSNVVNNGTATSITLRKQIDVAGKTGTTTNDFDRWFVGYTPYYIGGVWYGYEYPKSLTTPLKGYTNPPNVIWDTVMTRLHEEVLADAAAGTTPLKTFEMPSTVIRKEICKDSGKLMTDACRADPRNNSVWWQWANGMHEPRAEICYFAKGTEPTEECDVHVMVAYDTSTNAIACDACPTESVVQVGLIQIENRTFPTQVTVKDAQFVYRVLDANVEPGGWNGVPFFINMLEKDTYCGISYAPTGQYNCYCWMHFDFEAFNARVNGETTDPNAVLNPETPEGEPSKENETGDPPNPPDGNDPNQE